MSLIQGGARPQKAAAGTINSDEGAHDEVWQVRQDRRTFLQRWAALALGLADRTVAGRPAEGETMAKTASEGVTLFLCGDLMLGRGIDQVLPSPGDPQLYEPYVHSALGYLALCT